jgi:predicted metal-dependent phosphoesterase TrpH
MGGVKCDMHVHSYYSGLCTTPFARRFCRESYSNPEEVYERLSERGMTLFTLTDHDCIEGSEPLRRKPNFFLSEELTCRMPSGTEVHIGVYDFHERQHAQLQQRRNDLVALLMYLTERRLLFSINHVFSGLTGTREREDFAWFQNYFPAVETRNGHMLEAANQRASEFAAQWSKIGLGGSDAHALPSVGRTYTEVPGARDKDEFFTGLREGMGRVHGESGSYAKLTADVLVIAYELMREKAWTRLLSPLALLIPGFTLANFFEEKSFQRRWAEKVLGHEKAGKRPHWISVPQAAPQTAAGEWV